MSSTEVMKFEQGGLVISLSCTGNVANLTWFGTSDSREPSAFLDPVFRRVLDKIRDLDLVIDFSGLEFMNSSTVSPIIALLKSVDAKGIKCSVQFSDIDWQRTHMRCVQTIARVLPHVTVRSIPPRG